MFNVDGAYCLVDGQYGSTGKGLLAAYLAARYPGKIDIVVTSGGPNSGHTFYAGDDKVVLKQLPTFAIAHKKYHGREVPVFISGGAVVNPEILTAEVERHSQRVFMHRNAAVVLPEDLDVEHSGVLDHVASTRQGTGAAIARKVLRHANAVVGTWNEWPDKIILTDAVPLYKGRRTFVEVSQGFSLGINSRFYPQVTSRECTATQGLADARIPPQYAVKTFMAIRTYPIRVGNLNGNSSGDCYPDQEETSWEKLGQQPEMTTVTQRVRRVFTFSMEQYKEALAANLPKVVFVNFMNYLSDDKQRATFANELVRVARHVTGRDPYMLYGFGPRITDVYENPVGKR